MPDPALPEPRSTVRTLTASGPDPAALHPAEVRWLRWTVTTDRPITDLPEVGVLTRTGRQWFLPVWDDTTEGPVRTVRLLVAGADADSTGQVTLPRGQYDTTIRLSDGAEQLVVDTGKLRVG